MARNGLQWLNSKMKSILLIISFLLLVSSRAFNPGTIHKIETDSNYSIWGKYNPLNNWLLYNGIIVDSNNQITELNISARDLITGNEVKIEENMINPSIGWSDSLNVLISRTIHHHDSLLDTDTYKRVLYRYNVFSKSREYLKIPYFDSIYIPENDIVVSNNVLIYKIGFAYNKSTRFFRFNLDSSKFNEIEQLRGLDLYLFDYNSSKDILVYEVVEDSLYKLKCLKTNEIKTFLISNSYIEQFCLDFYDEKLYFISIDGQDHEAQQVLKCYDFEKVEMKTLYSFEKGVECLCVSPYKRNSVILSLGFETEDLSEHTFEGANVDVSIGLNPNRHLFIMDFEE